MSLLYVPRLLHDTYTFRFLEDEWSFRVIESTKVCPLALALTYRDFAIQNHVGPDNHFQCARPAARNTHVPSRCFQSTAPLTKTPNIARNSSSSAAPAGELAVETPTAPSCCFANDSFRYLNAPSCGLGPTDAILVYR